jgi:hypothetical protein
MMICIDSVLRPLGDGPDSAIHIEGCDPDDVMAQRPIDRFKFTEGITLMRRGNWVVPQTTQRMNENDWRKVA